MISDFTLEELLSGEEAKAEIQIINGTVPSEVIDPTGNNEYIQSSKNEYLLNIKNIAKYYVSDGNKIVVEPYLGADFAQIKPYLYNIVFEILMMQRGMVAIHGSAAVINEQCVIFTGMSGAGKSTLALALKKMNYPFITDDVAYLSFSENGSIMVRPGFPEHKLCKDTIEAVGVNLKSEPCSYSEQQEKYYLSVTNGLPDIPVHLHSIYELRPAKCNEVTILKIEGMEKVAALLRQTYPAKFLKLFGAEAFYFEKLTYISENTSVYQIMRPETGFTFDKQIELILKDWKDK
ncbi:hypothetical protein [Dehalobacter sp. UNSWDHB]|uniref:hypothetical protein n=1 Tax=Dehalobacter sp. UNSWDHB TaxID=1339256 RepID=UPI00187CC420|nr:hypothetical protein [Dehalobacter sp. UNSWDHB]